MSTLIAYILSILSISSIGPEVFHIPPYIQISLYNDIYTQTQKSLGLVTYIGSWKYITAAHVIDRYASGQDLILMSWWQPIYISDIYVYPDHDMADIYTRVHSWSDDVCRAWVYTGQTIYTYHSWNIQTGYIYTQSQTWFVHSISLSGGDSGWPVRDDRWCLLGYNVATDDNNGYAEYID
jgi:hypothetical protein